MMFVALAVEGAGEVERLFPGSKLDLDGPAGGVEFTQFSGVGFKRGEVGEHEVPAIANEGFGAWGFALFFGFFATLGASFSGDFFASSHGDESGMFFARCRL